MCGGCGALGGNSVDSWSVPAGGGAEAACSCPSAPMMSTVVLVVVAGTRRAAGAVMGFAEAENRREDSRRDSRRSRKRGGLNALVVGSIVYIRRLDLVESNGAKQG